MREKYRELAREHLGRLPALYSRFTGLLSHVTWAPKWPHLWNARDLPSQSQVCREVVDDFTGALARCRRCAARHLGLALESGHKGHRFTCFMGVHNFWLPIIVRGCVVGLAFVQALALPAPGASVQRKPLCHHRAPAPKTGKRASRQFGRATRRMARSDFWESAKLLHLVFEHVETSALAELRKSDLTQAQQALVELQTVATRLRRELNGLVPAFNKTAPLLEAENHTDRVVHAALEYVHRHYPQPFTLQQCASGLGLNAAYLSAQFSRAVGVPFKTYLTDVRVERARELLSDPAARIANVARAVGYASENRFRVAFKKVTGLSPRLWRETLRVGPCGKT
jgi:AraC-like DNA-binding protein